jgi:uncharacterized surface protein with fasciclin (FAS1) repeats
MYTGLTISLVLALAASVSGKQTVLRGNQNDQKIVDRKLQDATIAELATGTESLSTLVSLLDAAGLVGELSGTDVYTVFAPTNDAFAKLPQATLDAVTSNPTLLEDILEYHIIEGAAVLSTDLMLGMTPVTEEGSTVEVTSLDPVMINDATVTTADILASNGVVHLIDTVLIPPDDMDGNDPTMSPPVATDPPPVGTDSPLEPEVPPSGNTIVDLAVNTPQLSTLALLLAEAGFVDVLSGPGPFTVFAPSNAAFNKLSGSRWIAQNPELLNPILLYHVVGDATLLSTDLTAGAQATTLEGHPVTVTSLDPVTINRSVVTTADVVASNGVVHIIDKVLIPPFNP